MPFSRSRSFESMTRSTSGLVGAEDARLAQHEVDERGLAVVDVGDDGDVADLLACDHGLYGVAAKGRGICPRRRRGQAISGRSPAVTPASPRPCREDEGRPVQLTFHHLAVQCADLATCERFYREVLGLPLVRRWPAEGGGDRSVWLALGEGLLMLERASEAARAGSLRRRAARPPPRSRSASRAPSARRWEARLAARGVPVVNRTRFTLYLRDPEGNRVGLSHHPDEASPEGRAPSLPRRQLPVPARRRAPTRPWSTRPTRPSRSRWQPSRASPRAGSSTPTATPTTPAARPTWLRRLGAEVCGSSADAWGYPPDLDVAARRELVLGALRLEVHPSPGHTPGSVLISEVVTSSPATRSSGEGPGTARAATRGCWRRHSCGVLASLPGALLVEPGHDYAEQNLRFALELDPGCGAAAARLAAVREARARGEEPLPSTLAEERATNPFLRAEALRPALAARGLALGGGSPGSLRRPAPPEGRLARVIAPGRGTMLASIVRRALVLTVRLGARLPPWLPPSSSCSTPRARRWPRLPWPPRPGVRGVLRCARRSSAAGGTARPRSVRPPAT